MIEDFMFCYEMQCRTTGLGVFNVLCDFFHNHNCPGINVWVYVRTVQLQ